MVDKIEQNPKRIKYYKNRYMLAFYDKSDMLRHLFDNVKDLHDYLGIKDTAHKKYINTSISLHLKGSPRYTYIRCFKEPMKIHLIDMLDIEWLNNE